MYRTAPAFQLGRTATQGEAVLDGHDENAPQHSKSCAMNPASRLRPGRGVFIVEHEWCTSKADAVAPDGLYNGLALALNRCWGLPPKLGFTLEGVAAQVTLGHASVLHCQLLLGSSTRIFTINTTEDLLMKSFFTLILTLVLSTSMAWADDPPGPEDDIFVDEGAVIHQVGDANAANINQEAGPHAARIYQEGNDNIADIQQRGTNNTAFISQVGDGNDNDVEVAGTDNTALLVQEGDNMSLNLRVTEGQGRVADVRQYGETHTVGFLGSDGKILQSGDFNHLHVAQHGDYHTVTTLDGEDHIQAGDHNVIDVLQYGGRQLAKVGQFGDSNSMSIMQQGYSHTATVGQYGDGNSATIHQSGGDGMVLNPGIDDVMPQ